MRDDAGSTPDDGQADLRVEVVAREDLDRVTATHVAVAVANAVALRGACTIAFSGGGTPEGMLRLLGDTDLPWDVVHVVQVDERAAPAGSDERNLTMLQEHLVGGALPADHLHPMPVEGDLGRAGPAYEDVLRGLAGSPPVLDLVHLGIGSDGHTASLVPGDPVLDVTDRDVAATATYQGRRRLTLTHPAIDRARARLWQVAGAGKAAAVRQLVVGDASIPAGRVERAGTTVLLDEAAAAHLGR